MPTGNIVFVLKTASGALPINNGSITVTNEQGAVVFYEFLNAASNGLTKTAVLETPSKSISLDSDSNLRPYSIYNVSVRAERFYRIEIDGIQMFEGENANLPIELVPLPEGVVSPDDAEVIIIKIPEHILRSRPSDLQNDGSDGGSLPAVNVVSGVFVPETITVHLGAPNESAQNVTVPFIDYIKNVASSEIYPTWPKASLEANILAQISLTLNRIYTEWYRSQGYNFDITNSTAFDQAFVYGRNVFDETSAVVDEIFNRYIVRNGSVSPLFASYCNGTSTTCAGLSQWGTVALAESGQNSESIITFYYGDVVIEETDNIRANTESFGGVPLSSGDESEDVRIIQEQLNRIAINYPRIPLIEVNGVYRESTVESVSEFQRLFVLPITGVVDRATWYRISQIYSSVKRLSEISSEGQRAAYNQQLFPGYTLKLTSRGSEVQEIQFYLQRISRFNPTVQSPELDGIFGRSTQSAVVSFQNAYGLTPTGEINEADWARLVEVYNGTLDNVDEPQDAITPIPYPDFEITPDMSNEYVRYIQEVLNKISDVFIIVPKVDVDGVYGNQTQSAVNRFAATFGIAANGRINKALWDKINSVYSTVLSNCIFSTDESEGKRDFGGVTLSVGSSGEDVTYIQQRINKIYTALPYVGQLVPDGQYGMLTQNSVIALQRIFGLDESGTVNESTWMLINYIYAAVANSCLAASGNAIPTFADATDDDTRISVSELKELLRQNGINVGTGPIFGLKSRRALADWQIRNGLAPTGLPDSQTRCVLAKKRSELR